MLSRTVKAGRLEAGRGRRTVGDLGGSLVLSHNIGLQGQAGRGSGQRAEQTHTMSAAASGQQPAQRCLLPAAPAGWLRPARWGLSMHKCRACQRATAACPQSDRRAAAASNTAAAPAPTHVGEALLLPLVVRAVLRHGSKLWAARESSGRVSTRPALRRHRRRHRWGGVRPAPAPPALQACHRGPEGPVPPPGGGAGPTGPSSAHHWPQRTFGQAPLPRRLQMIAVRRCNMHAQ